ncbi:AbrB/MazE/SpoVT family DNA-binding domain-containing protein [Nocardia sp. alder85J]|uniref:AbrB/MazE/SpoVT family DNA-binding domain-containing protein n=1 Tax=Nocardia sp. alder85J TaxID=2862949 RepID=UPI001CD786B5|nr:AbrB/MazE/SpoVT family DNA-binding domain-containing protein [Nocardia sp. alder85J]MCX4098021.1 AbrB/MazE/SpoVT family DNA-binding domain-containing protein [Nocardia sp. alder85J]
MPATSLSQVRVVFGSVLVNHNGRIAERAVLGSLGWASGTPIDIRVVRPGILAVETPGGYAISRNGQLQIPAAIRRSAGLQIGHRVLLAAYPDSNRLIVLCQTPLHALVAGIAAEIDRGERS